jgi:hypothetical protein
MSVFCFIESGQKSRNNNLPDEFHDFLLVYLYLLFCFLPTLVPGKAQIGIDRVLSVDYLSLSGISKLWLYDVRWTYGYYRILLGI